MSIVLILMLFGLFQIKHFVIDFLFQPPYEWKNKGTYGHFGGIKHSIKHAFMTVWILDMTIIYFMSPSVRNAHTSILIIILGAIDFITHYHIDWAKMAINSKFNLTPTDKNFWFLLGFDQFLHQSTMLVIIGLFLVLTV